MLVALGDELDVGSRLSLLMKWLETLERFLFVEGARPFALVAVDEGLDIAL